MEGDVGSIEPGTATSGAGVTCDECLTPLRAVLQSNQAIPEPGVWQQALQSANGSELRKLAPCAELFMHCASCNCLVPWPGNSSTPSGQARITTLRGLKAEGRSKGLDLEVLDLACLREAATASELVLQAILGAVAAKRPVSVKMQQAAQGALHLLRSCIVSSGNDQTPESRKRGRAVLEEAVDNNPRPTSRSRASVGQPVATLHTTNVRPAATHLDIKPIVQVKAMRAPAVAVAPAVNPFSFDILHRLRTGNSPLTATMQPPAAMGMPAATTSMWQQRTSMSTSVAPSAVSSAAAVAPSAPAFASSTATFANQLGTSDGSMNNPQLSLYHQLRRGVALEPPASTLVGGFPMLSSMSPQQVNSIAAESLGAESQARPVAAPTEPWAPRQRAPSETCEMQTCPVCQKSKAAVHACKNRSGGVRNFAYFYQSPRKAQVCKSCSKQFRRLVLSGVRTREQAAAGAEQRMFDIMDPARVAEEEEAGATSSGSADTAVTTAAMRRLSVDAEGAAIVGVGQTHASSAGTSPLATLAALAAEPAAALSSPHPASTVAGTSPLPRPSASEAAAASPATTEASTAQGQGGAVASVPPTSLVQTTQGEPESKGIPASDSSPSQGSAPSGQSAKRESSGGRDILARRAQRGTSNRGTRSSSRCRVAGPSLRYPFTKLT